MKSLSYYHLLNKERTIINIIDDIERPYWDKFNKITREYFKGKDIRISKLNGNKKGYIQIRSAEWDNRIHYEWYPILFNELFFKDSPLKLCIHVEVNS